MKEELFTTLNSMNNGKSPRLDGVSCEFYKSMWYIVVNDFSHMDSESFSTRCLIEFINQGLIMLIPNNSLGDTIEGWRSITLLSIAYKIMANAMALQFRDVEKKIMHKEQPWYVQGRIIMDIMISTWESMEWVRESMKQALFLKIDFDKAYD